ncbi:MAG: hypothetical protein GX763_05685 [Clostridiaceae bacterium]|nr:hypothetical protein [Clostridiaceae bacterium]
MKRLTVDVVKKMKRAWSREDGVTLVELLAAIILLSIIVLSFMAFFTMSAKTNSRTNAVNEATFLAQEEIELITYYSTSQKTLDVMKEELEFADNSRSSTVNSYQISTVISPQSELYKIVVTVSKGGETRAKMETVLPFAEEAETTP